MATVLGAKGFVTPSEYEQKILAALDEEGGLTTGKVADLAFPVAPAANASKGSLSARVRRALLILETHGLVDRLDDQKPTTWRRTKLGTEAMKIWPR